MDLINGMAFDQNGGICLRENYRFYTYDNQTHQTGQTDINLYTGEYVAPLKNINMNFSADTEDQEICIVLQTGETITGWTIGYVNAYVTTGYSEQYEKEERVIFDSSNGVFYSILHTGTTTCSADTSQLWSIIDINTNIEWTGGTSYMYWIEDSCGQSTGLLAVKLKDINRNSPTAFQVINYTI